MPNSVFYYTYVCLTFTDEVNTSHSRTTGPHTQEAFDEKYGKTNEEKLRFALGPGSRMQERHIAIEAHQGTTAYHWFCQHKGCNNKVDDSIWKLF